MPPAVPFNHYRILATGIKQYAGHSPLFHALLFNPKGCFEHSNFLKVKTPFPQFVTFKCKLFLRCEGWE